MSISFSNTKFSLPLINVVCVMISSGIAKLGELIPKILPECSKAFNWKVTLEQ